MTITEFYTQVNGSYAEAVSRFRDDARIKRFLALFLRDETVGQLKTAVAAEDWPSAFRAAHTLKGVAANLSLSAFAAHSSELTEVLRGPRPLTVPDYPLYETVLSEYEKIIAAIPAID